MYYAIEMNGTFVKEFKSLQKAINWVFSRSKMNSEKEYPDCLTIWKVNNHQRHFVLSNNI